MPSNVRENRPPVRLSPHIDWHSARRRSSSSEDVAARLVPPSTLSPSHPHSLQPRRGYNAASHRSATAPQHHSTSAPQHLTRRETHARACIRRWQSWRPVRLRCDDHSLGQLRGASSPRPFSGQHFAGPSSPSAFRLHHSCPAPRQ